MADKVGDEFDGYITGVTAFGLFIELIEHFVEGLVHVTTMADDYYRFVEGTHILRGENNGKVYRVRLKPIDGGAKLDRRAARPSELRAARASARGRGTFRARAWTRRARPLVRQRGRRAAAHRA